ncbi:MAG: hypothetical protein M1813_001578 [Trichoglossum hirsutum]|nr:MAG: hypothetical protein M1813_001578 [Trichoglossum hirsutum]
MYLLKSLILFPLVVLPGTDAQIPRALTDSASSVLSGSSTLLQAGANEVGRLASSYGSVAIDTAKKLAKDDVPKGISAAATWSAQNPMLAGCAIAGATGIAIVAAPATISAPLLSTVGCSAGGVKAGTLAAAAQGSIGNVAAGSLFATAQSAGAGGAGLTIVNGIAQMGGAVMAAESGGLAWGLSVQRLTGFG